MATRAQIERLKAEAGQVGDTEQVKDCQKALDGNQAAWRRCGRALKDAEAQDDNA